MMYSDEKKESSECGCPACVAIRDATKGVADKIQDVALFAECCFHGEDGEAWKAIAKKYITMFSSVFPKLMSANESDLSLAKVELQMMISYVESSISRAITFDILEEYFGKLGDLGLDDVVGGRDVDSILRGSKSRLH